MNTDTKDLISITEIGRVGVSSIINEAADGRSRVVLRNNRPVAAIVGIDAMERIQELDEREEELRLLGLAIARLATDSGKRYSLRDVAERYGFDLDELTAEVAAEDGADTEE